jgi:hypothetical protein
LDKRPAAGAQAEHLVIPSEEETTFAFLMMRDNKLIQANKKRQLYW